jgi:hypothetical protein
VAGRAQKIDISTGTVKPKAFKGERFTGQQMNAALSGALPIIKAARAETERRGRKPAYTRERFTAVLERMGAGETQGAAVKAEGIAPSMFHRWTEQAHGGEGWQEEVAFIREALARAKRQLADQAFSEALDVPRQLYALALSGTKDGPAVDSAMVQAGKLLTDSLWRYAQSLNPAAYDSKASAAPVINVDARSVIVEGRTLDASQRAQLRALLDAARAGTAGTDD